MRRNHSLLVGVGIASVLAASLGMNASAATLRPCLPGHKVKIVKGHATMVVKGKTVKCAIVKKPAATPSPTPTSTYPTPSNNPLVRFAGAAMNNLVVRVGLTVTLRNADAVPHTLVIASEGISVLVPANDISAFLAPNKVGTYAMTTAEDPLITATLTVVP